MAEKFTPLAQSRASYYCKGSPVHFVRVELFRMESTGETVVTLTFKNLYSRPLKEFTAYFRCKNRHGEVVAEDSFTYSGLNVGEGECFGCDDGVFVSEDPLASVEVRLGSVTYDDGRAHDLRRCQPVTLPPLRPLPPRERALVCRALNTDEADFYPEEAPDGWRCTCGAFNYNAGRAKHVCSECHAEKLMMQAAVREAEKGGTQDQPQYSSDMQFLPVEDAPKSPRGGNAQYAVTLDHAIRQNPVQQMPQAQQPDAEGTVSIMKDSTADFILRYGPLVTLAASAIFTMGAVLIAQMMM